MPDKTIDKWMKKHNIVVYKPRGDTTVRRLCDCGAEAYSSGPRMCHACFEKYVANVINGNRTLVVIHAACYSSEGPIITHLERVRTHRSGVYTDTNPKADHSHWGTSTEDFTYCNERVSQDWVDAMRYAMHQQFHPGMNSTFRATKNRG